MNFDTLAWLFAAAVTLHNLEEAIWLPAWSKGGGRWRLPVEAADFRFAVAVLTAAAWASARLATMQSPFGVYVLCGYALAMLVNAFIPHLAATIILRSYAPGLATGLSLNFPISALLLACAVTEGQIKLSIFAWTGPLTVVVLALSIPLLFWIARALR